MFSLGKPSPLCSIHISYNGTESNKRNNSTIRTWEANGKKNGAGRARIDNEPSMHELFEDDVWAPGFVTIPVCSAQEAMNNWDLRFRKPDRHATFPCNKV